MKNPTQNNQGKIKKTVIEYSIIVMVSIIVGILVSYIQCPQCNIFKDIVKGIPISLVFGLSLFKGIGWIFAIISNKYSWVETPFRLLFLHCIHFLTLCVCSCNYYFYFMDQDNSVA